MEESHDPQSLGVRTSNCVRILEDLDVVREVTGRQRGRIYTYERYLAILRGGTEDPPG